MKELIDKLKENRTLSKREWVALIEGRSPALTDYLYDAARSVRHRYYGHDVYVRGLIEFTNYCRNDCLYCGIRKSNSNVSRYRLTEEQILSCCDTGYQLGFRTFVLQGGEDGCYDDSRLGSIISGIKTRWPDCALTLSIGERSYDSYQYLYDAGAEIGRAHV